MSSSFPDAPTGARSSHPCPPVEPNAEKSLPPSETDTISSEEENLLDPHSIPGTLGMSPALGGPRVLNHLPPNGVIEVPDVEVKEETVEECHHTEMDSRQGR